MKILLLFVIMLSICGCNLSESKTIDNNIEMQNATINMSFASNGDNIYYYTINNSQTNQMTYDLIEFNLVTKERNVIDNVQSKSKLCVAEDNLYYLKNSNWQEFDIMRYGTEIKDIVKMGSMPMIGTGMDLMYQYMFPINNQIYINQRGETAVISDEVNVLENKPMYSTYLDGEMLYYCGEDGGIYKNTINGTPELVIGYDELSDDETIKEYINNSASGIVSQLVKLDNKLYFLYGKPSLEISTNKLFAYSDNKISLIGNEKSYPKMFEIYNDRLYYVGKLEDGEWKNNLYVSDLNGNNEKKIAENVQNFCIYKDNIFYEIYTSNSIGEYEYSIYKYHINRNSVEQIEFVSNK